jgi:hypothetical protein
VNSLTIKKHGLKVLSNIPLKGFLAAGSSAVIVSILKGEAAYKPAAAIDTSVYPEASNETYCFVFPGRV